MGIQTDIRPETDENNKESEQENGQPPLLLHSCCAPCSSHVLELLSDSFEITVFYFNPNIFPVSEYEKRRDEQLRLIGAAAYQTGVSFMEADYSPELFESISEGLEASPEGGERCRNCIALRLSHAAKAAAHIRIKTFASTLTVSPHKDAAMVNRAGEAAAAENGVFWLSGDYKKNGGWQNSLKLSKKYGLYRQNYCGCVYSMRK